jgi:Bacterial inner membrane protein.
MPNTQIIIAQAIGILGMIAAMLSFQCKSSKKMFIIQAFCAGFFLIHFGLLGAAVGMLQNVLAIVRAMIFRSEKKWAQHKSIPYIFGVLFLLTILLTYDGPITLLPPIAMVISTFAMWTKNGKKIRILQLFTVSPMWLIYNAFVLSISGCITEAFNIVSILVSIARYGINGFDKATPVTSEADK